MSEATQMADNSLQSNTKNAKNTEKILNQILAIDKLSQENSTTVVAIQKQMDDLQKML